jgi:uncharacterized protein
MVEIVSVALSKPAEVNVIIGQSHFIKTVEDLYEAVVNCVPGALFGVAFCEASGACKIRVEGTDPQMADLARHAAQEVAAGHTFYIFLKNVYPINVLNAVKSVPEVCGIFCATANPVEVIVARTPNGGGILGVVDGASPKGIEDEKDVAWRKSLLRQIGYKR